MHIAYYLRCTLQSYQDEMGPSAHKSVCEYRYRPMMKPENNTMAGNMTDPIQRLAWHYQNPSAEAIAFAGNGGPVVGVTSNTVPWELIRAAGAFPYVLSSGDARHPDIPNFMEEGVFEERIRAIFGAAISGALRHLSLLLIPRTSEQEYKLYLYLREVARQEPERCIPPVYLYDLLHTNTPESQAYGLERTQCLKTRLEELTGQTISRDALRCAIDESNSARKAIRMITALRQPEPKICGAEALALIGPAFFINRDEYSRLAHQAAAIIARRDPYTGKKILLTGASLNHQRLHQALEAHGAVVVAEDDWWGARSAGEDIDTSDDLIKAVFSKYHFDTPSPRRFPFTRADEWFQQAVVHGIDGVVFYLPPEDCVAGWDYPRRRRYLDEQGIPHLLIREDARSLSETSHEQLEQFVSSIGVAR